MARVRIRVRFRVGAYRPIGLGLEADVGMFSMFGRIGAPQKDKKIVCYAYKYYSNTPSLANSLLQKGWPQTASQLRVVRGSILCDPTQPIS